MSVDGSVSNTFDCCTSQKLKKMSHRYSNLSSDDEENQPLAKRARAHKKSVMSKKWDEFCWKCHKECDEEVRCSNCILSFHKNCASNAYKTKADWKCSECRAIQKTEQSNRNGHLPEMLQIAVDRVKLKNISFTLPSDYIGHPSLINPITFDDIIAKVKASAYNSIDDLQMDFKWLRHNCGILSNLSKNGDIRTKANEIYEFCCNEISDMKKCADCYVHYGSFTSICSPPHILLWVRFSGLTYWPAKLVSIGKGPKPLTVYFFEEYSTAEVSFKDCFLYSKEDPNEWIANNGKERVLNAILEAEQYIKNVEEKFGAFHFAPKYKQLVSNDIDEYLDEIIPGFRNPSPIQWASEPTNQTFHDYDDDEMATTSSNIMSSDISLGDIPSNNNTDNGSARCGCALQDDEIDQLIEYVTALNKLIAAQKEEIDRLNKECKRHENWSAPIPSTGAQLAESERLNAQMKIEIENAKDESKQKDTKIDELKNQLKIFRHDYFILNNHLLLAKSKRCHKCGDSFEKESPTCLNCMLE